mgnify:CR=1 FL=1
MSSENRGGGNVPKINEAVALKRYLLDAQAIVRPLMRVYTEDNAPNTKSWHSYNSTAVNLWSSGEAFFDRVGSKSYYSKVCAGIRAAGPFLVDGFARQYIQDIDRGVPVSPVVIERFSTFLKYVVRLCEGGDAYGENRTFLTDNELMERISKVKMLSKMPVGWAGMLFAHAIRTKGDDRPLINSIALAMNTGARPAEVAVGMKLSLCDDGLRLDIDNEIKERREGDRGLGPRWIEMPINTLSRQYLRGVLNLNKEIMLQGMHEKAFCDATIDLGRELFPTLKETVSPYCIRHQVATDLKVAGWSWGAIATALGQKTDECTSVYGRARGKSDGSLVPARVGADNKPLEKRRQPGPPRRGFDFDLRPPGFGPS